MQHTDHSHAHRHTADDYHGRRAELESVVHAHLAEGLAPPGYATRGLAALEAAVGPDDDRVD